MTAVPTKNAPNTAAMAMLTTAKASAERPVPIVIAPPIANKARPIIAMASMATAATTDAAKSAATMTPTPAERTDTPSAIS